MLLESWGEMKNRNGAAVARRIRHGRLGHTPSTASSRPDLIASTNSW
jgi:hypothetical protein